MSLWDNWRDERGCDEGHWHAHTRGLPWGLPEIVGTVQVHCSRRRLLRRGLEFHECTINKSAHTKKVWKLIKWSLYIYLIMSCRLHGYPWLSLASSPYCSSLPAGLQDYILYPHIAAVCMFKLVILLLLGHMWGSIGVHYLWARLCFSSSDQRVWFV